MENRIHIAQREVFELNGKEAVRFHLPDIFKLNSEIYMNTAIANAVFNTKKEQYDSQLMADFLHSKASNLLKIEKILLY